MELVGKLRRKNINRELGRWRASDAGLGEALSHRAPSFRVPNETSYSLVDTETAAYLLLPPPSFRAASLLARSIFLSFPVLIISYLSAHPPLVCSIYFWYL